MQPTDARQTSPDKVQDLEIALLQSTLAAAMTRIAELDQIGRVFHDFNNILSSSMGYASLAGERAADMGDEKLSRYVNNIEKAGVRARDLVRECLEKRQSYRDQQTSMLAEAVAASMELQGLQNYRKAFAESVTLNMALDPARLVISLLSRGLSACDSLVFEAQVEEEIQCSQCGHELRGMQLHLSIKGEDAGACAVNLAAEECHLASSIAAAYGGHLCESLVQDREIVVYLKASAS